MIYLFDTDLNELTLPKTCTTEFPDPDDLLNFKLTICPDEVGEQYTYFIQFGILTLLFLFLGIIQRWKIQF